MLKNRFMRQERGSIAVYAIATILSFIFILSGIFFNSAGIRKNQLRTLLKIKEIYSQEVEVKDITKWEFGYTGNAQKWIVPATGYYQLQVWGAQGGGRNSSKNTSSGLGGKGGYAKGEIYLTKDTVLYIYVGETGGSNISSSGKAVGGFNGGGTGGGTSSGEPGNGGGGATDIRVKSESLWARVIVAGGGGGGGEDSSDTVGAGGGTSGKNGGASTAGTISSGGTGALFGLGANTNYDGGAGGGGWYGGGANGGRTDTSWTSNSGTDAQGGSGGSGWVYTQENYQAWRAGNPTDEADWELSEEYYLINVEIKDGASEMPTHNGTETMIGNEENGYAKITWRGYRI